MKTYLIEINEEQLDIVHRALTELYDNVIDPSAEDPAEYVEEVEALKDLSDRNGEDKELRPVPGGKVLNGWCL